MPRVYPMMMLSRPKKNTRRLLVVFVLLAMTASLRGQSGTALPTLRGDDAVGRLKQSRGYDSLMRAVNAARREGACLEESAAPDAVGQPFQLLAANGAQGDSFGTSVAISGDTAVIGAYGYDVGVDDKGSAYVFTRNGSVWTQQAKLLATDGAQGDFFGDSVAISGDTAVVGASGVDVGANSNQGSAYVFSRSGGVWTQQAKLLASDGAQSNYLGESVAISGDTVLVGTAGNRLKDSAYIFIRSGTVWTQQAQLFAPTGAPAHLVPA